MATAEYGHVAPVAPAGSPETARAAPSPRHGVTRSPATRHRSWPSQRQPGRGGRAARGAAAWRAAVDGAPVAVAAGGRLVAAGAASGTVWVLDAADGEPVSTVTLPGGLLDLAFSPDGDHLFLTGPRGYALWHAAGGHAAVLASGRRSARVRWAAAGHAAVADGRTAVVLDAGGRLLWRTAPQSADVTDLAWLPGGGLAVAGDNEVTLFERRRPDPVARYALGGAGPRIAVAPDGRWASASGQDLRLHPRQAGPADGRTLAAARLTMDAPTGPAACLAFDDTGGWLAAGFSPRLAVWDVTDGGAQAQAAQALCAHDTVTALAWRPGNSRILATAGAEGTVALWDAPAGKPGRWRITTAGWALEDDVAAIAWNGPGTLLVATGNGIVRSLDPDSPDPGLR